MSADNSKRCTHVSLSTLPIVNRQNQILANPLGCGHLYPISSTHEWSLAAQSVHLFVIASDQRERGNLIAQIPPHPPL